MVAHGHVARFVVRHDLQFNRHFRQAEFAFDFRPFGFEVAGRQQHLQLLDEGNAVQQHPSHRWQVLLVHFVHIARQCQLFSQAVYGRVVGSETRGGEVAHLVLEVGQDEGPRRGGIVVVRD